MLPGRNLSLPALIFLLACTGESPEARVRQRFEATVQALEKGRAEEALEVLAPDFSGPEGLDRAAAGLFLRGLLRQGRLGIHVLRSRIEAREQDAVQEVTVVVTQRQGATVLPDDTTRRSFRLKWERRKGEWYLKRLQPAETQGEG